MGNYIDQICVIKRKTMTLGIDCKLSIRDVKKEAEPSPLTIHDGFSRFELTIIDTGAGKGALAEVVSANIRISDFAGIMALSQAALFSNASTVRGDSKEEGDTEGEGETSFTEEVIASLGLSGKTFAYGDISGKTPADLLRSGKLSADFAKRLHGTLSKNADKFPLNKILMDDLQKILNLMEGKTASVSASNATIPVYCADIRTKTQTDKEGRSMVYGVEIYADFSMENPWCIKIFNCYAPVKISHNGLKMPEMSKAVEKKSKNIRLSNLEYFNMISRMDNTAKNFEALHFGKLIEVRDSLAWHPKKET